MNALEFFNSVTRPNITAAILADGNYRVVVNAILSVDANYGIMFEQLKNQRHPFLQSVPFKGKEMRDNHFKDAVATRSHEFRAIRDAAYATKHGRLSGRERLVQSADDVSSMELSCGLFACGDALGGSAVFLSRGGNEPLRAWALLRRVELFSDEFMGELGIGPLECPIPEYHDARALCAA